MKLLSGREIGGSQRRVTLYAWDGSGNRTAAGPDVYTYDARNQILTGPEGDFTYTARGTTDTVSDGVTTVIYSFDAFGRLTDYNGEATYTHDGMDRVAERDGVAFTYAGPSLDPISDGGFTYAHSPGGRVLAVDDGTSSFLAGTNRHGDLTHLFTTAGAIVDSSLYDPFGDVVGESGTVDPTIGFQSDYTDPASEHVWMGARWYDGGRAAFLSRDTVFGELGTPISLNRYTYGFANPLAFWDPDGRISQQIIADEISASEQIKKVAGQKSSTARMLALNMGGPATASSEQSDAEATTADVAQRSCTIEVPCDISVISSFDSAGFESSSVVHYDPDAGTAIIVFGDLDASNIAVMFPGIENDLSNLENPLGETQRLHEESLSFDLDTGSVLCFCYDTPDGMWAAFVQAVLPGDRNWGDVEDLAQSMGLDEEQNVTLVGHSFGARIATRLFEEGLGDRGCWWVRRRG